MVNRVLSCWIRGERSIIEARDLQEQLDQEAARVAAIDNDLAHSCDTVATTSSDDEKLCVVCLDQPREVFFIPCGHICTCEACGNLLRNSGTADGLCPLCRLPIEGAGRCSFAKSEI